LAIWLGGKLLQEIQEITFEIGMLGQYGPDIYDPQGTRVLRVLLGRVFSALEMGCIKYAGFKEDRAGDGYRGGYRGGPGREDREAKGEESS
jgi:hypothetical protein